MKTQLTKEQSQHLIELGFPKWKVQEIKPSDVSLKDWTPTITLIDLLEILPKEIDATFQGMELITINKCEVGYAYNDPYDGLIWEKHIVAEELIDALYELLCWVIENKYIKI